LIARIFHDSRPFCLAVILISPEWSPTVAEETPPHIVFILADDLGCHDLSGEGSRFYVSPHIDSIAAGGMRFTQGYAACQVCSPSRASILTGQSPARHGITNWIGAPFGARWQKNTPLVSVGYADHLDQRCLTLSELLQAAGYATFFAGKWHLGGAGSLPTDHGFDINIGGSRYGSPRGGYFAPFASDDIAHEADGQSLTLRLGHEAAQFIAQVSDRPFFVYLSFYAVHSPIQTTRPLWDKYRQRVAEVERERFIIDRTLPVRQVQDNPIYAGMIETMDDAVGLVLKSLAEHGHADNTIICFTSDNGGVSSGDAYSTSNLPFRGGKGRQWEGGIREPFYIKAPGITRPGSSCETPVIGMDFYPTLLELAGLKCPSEQPLDGVSLAPLLRGESIAERNLYWHYPHYGNQGGEPSSIIRSGVWKLIHYWEDGRDELYHLDADVMEQNDLAQQRPDVATSLRAKLDAWLAETGALLPPNNENYNAGRAAAERERIRGPFKRKLEKAHAAYLDPAWQPNQDWWGSQVTHD
jgi:arylsulfatase A-like enzyme